MKKSILLIALAALLLSFVSWDETEGINKIPFGHPDSTVAATLKILEKKYSAIPYFAKLDDQYLFYVVNGQWIDTSRTEFARGNFLMGLVNEKNEIILPCEYTKLYNPDATARGYIEIEKNGKRGLVNYHTKKIIAAEYDVIFEREDLWDAIAVGRIGTQFYKIQPDGRKTPYVLSSDYDPQKLYYLLRGHENINQNSKITLIFELYPKMDKWGSDTTEIKGLYIAPSYLSSIKFDEKFSELDLFQIFYGTNMIGYHCNFQSERSENVFSFINTFIEKGVMERGWTIEHNSIVTTDSVGKLIDHCRIMDLNEFEYFNVYADEDITIDYENLYAVYEENDSVIRVSCLRDSISGLDYYNLFSYDYFYSISRNGKIEKLQSNRVFHISKFIAMKESDFEGVYIHDTAKSEYETMGKGLMWSHLSLDDLELMRNEIFADYGYKFKNEKWKKYFSKQKWYNPKYDNVEQFLTAIDKHNIELIKKTEELLKKDKMLSKPKSVEYGWGW